MGFDERFDVIVIGAGHAGCEAASASARMGAKTAIVTLNLDLIGQMSCNPAIGGIAKGHLVREIDALGGIMGRVIDRTGVQFRLLNRSRGPAVRSPRAQADRALYRSEMRYTLENTPNLYLRQGVVVELIVGDGVISGVELQDTRRFKATSVILATGTFLNGLIHTGRRQYSAGRAGEPASIDLAANLRGLGLPVGRLKTGTPPRLDGRTIDWSAFQPQPADEQPVPFSFSTDSIDQPQLMCHIGYTNEAVHQSIRDNLAESPLYSGQITGTGPRYCPSIEDKVVKFPHKDRHQLFLEPEGHNTHEVYLNGLSTSLPFDLQQQIVRQVPGLDATDIIRPGYAIEYDFVDPRQLTPYLETSKIKGLFFAGQINGTTGYEEAACQGLIAGINAASASLGRQGLRLDRDSSYIGVLVDDLIKHGVDEPYRIFTSRAENRLSLRYDSADERLTPIGRDLGLVGDDVWDRFHDRRQRLVRTRQFLEATRFKRSDPQYSYIIEELNIPLGDSFTLLQLTARADVPLPVVAKFLPHSVCFSDLETVAADVVYSRYIDAQRSATNRVHHNDGVRIPESFSYKAVAGLSTEMLERLERVRPRTFGEARLIPSLTPAALSTLLIYLHSHS